MKRSLTLVCMLASAMGAASTYAAQAQNTEPPSAPAPAGQAQPPEPLAATSKIAVIAFQQAVMATNEGQRNIAQLRAKYEPKQAQLKTESDEVDSLKKQLQDAGSGLSQQERDTRMQTIDQKTKTLQREAEDDQNDFNSDMNNVYTELAQKVYAVMDSYATQQGFTVVLDASQQQNAPSPILWEKGADITKAVIEAYNAHSGITAPASRTSLPRTTPRRTPQQ